MNNSALFNAFTKVKSEVEEAVSARRERDEKERLREEKARIEAKREAREKERRAYLKKAEEAEKELEAERARAERRRNAAKAMSTTADSSEREAPARGGRRDGTVGERGRTNARGRGDGRREPNRDAAGGRNGRGPRGARGARGGRDGRDARDVRLERGGRSAGAATGLGALKEAVRERESRRPWIERRNPIPPFKLMAGLPVSERGDELVRMIRENQVSIVCGETGSGKTTQLPKIALMAGCGTKGRIAHTQPRRIAASSIAKRIAEEMKTPLGEVVGYKVRFSDHTEPGATIKLMTDGILLAETQTDPLLRAYDTIIIDEAHERSINIDFLLGYLKRLILKRPELKVIITSATIDAERFSEHFTTEAGPAPIAMVSGRTYPVEIRYRPLEDVDDSDDATLLDAIDRAVDELERTGRGDILVFLPGEREIREAADQLRKTRNPRTTEVLPLFARLSAAEQERVFKPGALRRIVLATNVAETSITVPGIRFVVDTGLARVNRYSYRNKVEQLHIEPISQAAANQRAGRCGRTADGVCIRLYSEEDFARRPEFTDPEILRSNLAGVILRATALKLGDVRDFPFVSAPPPKAFADGFALLRELDALDDDGRLTRIGRELSRLPVDPRFARMLLAGHERDALHELLVICSGLSIQDPRERPQERQQAADEAHKVFSDKESDFMSYLKLWKWVEEAFRNKESNRKLEQRLHQHFLSVKRLREWREVYHQLERMVGELDWRINTAEANSEAIHRSLLAGLLGNIGSKAVNSDFKAPPYNGARGIKFWLWPGSVRAKKGGRWIMAAELIDTQRLYAREVAEIQPEWIEAEAGTLIKKHRSDPHWEKRRGEVVASEKGTLYGLTVYQGRSVGLAPHDPALAREIFIRQALVEEDLDIEPSFYKKNRRLIAQIEELEHKTRRPDVLVDDELLFAFYDERLPADVCSSVTLKTYLKANPGAERAGEEKSLVMTREDLMRHDAGNVLDIFPKNLTQGGVTMELGYHFEPGSPRDGVTMTVPLYALNQVDAVAAEWLVLGMVKEKCAALIKSLPQKIRRHLIPLQAYAEGFYSRVYASPRPGTGFLEVLSEDIRTQTGVECYPKDFKVEQLPPHLLMNFKVVDDRGIQIGMGRNLAELKAEFRQEASESFQAVASHEGALEAAGDELISGWTFGELPELLEIKRGGQTLIGHPALVDVGTGCRLEVFDDPEEAHEKHMKGLMRLFKIALKEQVRYIERELRDVGRLQMQVAAVPALGKRFDSTDGLIEEVVDATLTASALVQPLPIDAESFSERREETKARIVLVSGELHRLLKEIAEAASPIPSKLKKFDGEPIARDVTAQLESLFPPHFFVKVPLEQLRHYPRYLKAVDWRLDRYRDAPERDQEHLGAIERLMAPYWRKLSARKGRYDVNLERFFWMVQELRVSLFAQKLRTPMPVSVKRLERVWQTIERM